MLVHHHHLLHPHRNQMQCHLGSQRCRQFLLYKMNTKLVMRLFWIAIMTPKDCIFKERINQIDIISTTVGKAWQNVRFKTNRLQVVHHMFSILMPHLGCIVK